MASISTEAPPYGGGSALHFVLAGTSTLARVSGATVAFDLAVHGVRERGHRVSVVDFAHAGTSDRVGAFAGGRALRTLRPLARGIARIANADGLYIVISTSRAGFLRDAALIWTALLLGRATVLHLHGGGYDTFYATQPRWLRAWIRATLSRASALVVLGRALESQFSFLPRANLVAIPNGLPTETEPPERQPHGLAPPIRLLYLSNLIESKGYLELVRACAILRTGGLNLTCDVCGDFVRTAHCSAASAEDARRAFFRLVDELDLQDVVQYRGVVRGPDKQAILERAHVLVLPTAYPGEGQPLSIIEALAFGVPVVATRFRGIPEQVVDDENGYLIESSAPDRIAAAVRDVVRDEANYARLSVAARRRYLDHFRQDVHVARLAGLLEDTAARRNARAGSS